MTKTTPRFFFENFVQENYNDSEQHPESIRYAFNAAISAAHLADHYWEYYKKYDPSKMDYKNLQELRNHVNNETEGDYNHILSLANAYKHLYERENQAHWTLASPGVLQCINLDKNNSDIHSIEFESENDTKLVFTCIDGTKNNFLNTLSSVIKFWDEFLP
jgi:hypothetical protein